ncbi:DUF418 domain-containing protein [Streptomyces sp. NPDC001514]
MEGGSWADAVIGHGGSWLALHLVPDAQAAVNAATDTTSAASAWWSDAVGAEPAPGVSAWLLVDAPHSQTTWSILGNTGVALVVVAVCLFAMDRSVPLRWVAAPVIAVGSMSLTAYVGHIVAIKALSVGDLPDSALLPALVGLIAAAMLLALAWRRVNCRGPLESLLHAITLPTRPTA